MFDGYFALGGREIGNTARAIGLQQSSDCPLLWLDADDTDYSTVAMALFEPEYTLATVTEAPWYDPDSPDRSSRILGLSIINISGLDDDTRQAEMQEKVTEGAHLGRTRWAGRQVRITALLTAKGQDALAAGMTWLRSALTAKSCGIHGSACNLTDFEFFMDRPPTRGTTEIIQGGFGFFSFGFGPFGLGPPTVIVPGVESDAVYLARVDTYRRYLHQVKTISGPYVVRPLQSRRHPDYYGNIVEFTIGAEVPHIFTKAREVTISPTIPTVVNDIPFNFARRPRPASAIEPKVVAIKQMSENPSLETDASGWGGSVASVSGDAPAAYFTAGRVTGELAAVGLASMRTRILGNGATEDAGRARMTVQHDVDLDDADERCTLSIWAAAVSVGGATGAGLVSVTAKVEWRTSGALVSTSTIGTSTVPADIAGKAWSLISQKPPATATIARLIVEFVVDWSSSATPASNSDVRAYVDAAAVTVP